ncbi:magnesium transporter [Candidatus Woesearchaeota archaeon]|nr:magnesium transporter [Candidatus Woesearchaeota archaeon]
MRNIKKHLDVLKNLKREKYHPLIHKIHKKHKISKKTLFYVKEYGQKSNAFKTIIKESVKILFFASIVSSLGGFAIENVKNYFILLMPLVILLPALNDMFGDYGTIISSRFSTMLHEGKIKNNLFINRELKELIKQIFIIALIMGVFSAIAALTISNFVGYNASMNIAIKIILMILIDIVLLVGILFLVSIIGGLYFYKKGEDPNNFLIPITTSIADFGNMFILLILLILFF